MQIPIAYNTDRIADEREKKDAAEAKTQRLSEVERFHRTMLEEWAYARPYYREADRIRALARWLHITTITACTPRSAVLPGDVGFMHALSAKDLRTGAAGIDVGA